MQPTDHFEAPTPEMHDPAAATILLGLSGLITMGIGLVTHYQEQIEWWLRLTTMGVGLGVSLLSGAVLWKKWRGK